MPIRKAFRMKLHAGQEAEYERRHRPIWVELEQALRSHGVHSYSIFLDPDTGDLFACAEIESEDLWSAIASSEACRRWWAYMSPLMASHPDDRPVAKDLREVFHL